jgi:hypothetical protein
MKKIWTLIYGIDEVAVRETDLRKEVGDLKNGVLNDWLIAKIRDFFANFLF